MGEKVVYNGRQIKPAGFGSAGRPGRPDFGWGNPGERSQLCILFKFQPSTAPGKPSS